MVCKSLFRLAFSHIWLDLRVMLSDLRVTKDIFRSRMNIIKDSFKIHYKLRSQKSPSTELNCRFEIINHFNYRESKGQCQLNLIAYQLGKIEEMEKEALPAKQVKVNRCQYYYDLSGKNISNDPPLHVNC